MVWICVFEVAGVCSVTFLGPRAAGGVSGVGSCGSLEMWLVGAVLAWETWLVASAALVSAGRGVVLT